jgi:hypothetical protein
MFRNFNVDSVASTLHATTRSAGNHRLLVPCRSLWAPVALTLILLTTYTFNSVPCPSPPPETHSEPSSSSFSRLCVWFLLFPSSFASYTESTMAESASYQGHQKPESIVRSPAMSRAWVSERSSPLRADSVGSTRGDGTKCDFNCPMPRGGE